MKKKKSIWKKIGIIILSLIGLFFLISFTLRAIEKYNRGYDGQEVTSDQALKVGRMSYTVNEIEVTDKIIIDNVPRGTSDADGTQYIFAIIHLTLENNHLFRDYPLPPPNNMFTLMTESDNHRFGVSDEASELLAKELRVTKIQETNLGKRTDFDSVLAIPILEEALEEQMYLNVSFPIGRKGKISLDIGPEDFVLYEPEE